MAVIGESGIKRDSDSSTPLERHSQPNSNFSHSNGSPSGLSNGSDLRKSQSVAKPRETSSGSNPLQKVAQRRNKGTNYTRPTRPSGGNGSQEAGSEAGQEQQTQPSASSSNVTKKEGGFLKNPFKKKNNSSNSNANGDSEKSPGQELGDKLGYRIKKFLMKHPIVILYILLAFAVIAILYIVIAAIVAVLSGGAAYELGAQEQQKNYGDFFAFDHTSVYLLDENGSAPIGSRAISLGDYIKGIIYADTMNVDVSRLSEEQLINYYSALIVAKKAEILKKGNYNNKSKSISLKVTDFNYCDAEYGCKLVSKGGRRFYLSNTIEYKVDSEIKSYDAMESRKLSALNDAYTNMLSKIATPDSVNEPLTEYKWSAPVVTSSMYTSWANNAANGTKYDNILKGSFPNYKVYDLDDYVTQFESVFLSSYSYWWPIGSKNVGSDGLYSDDPESTSVISEYGPSFSTGTINKGITISGTCGSTKVVAIADGKVTYVGSNDKYGKYVIVSHDDNVQSLYGSLQTVSVSNGTSVTAGKLIGTVGKIGSSSTCGLYFEMYKNGSNVNPMDYISADNPRVSKAKYIKFVQGADNKQTVCKTFLATGFNKNAVAGLMANIERESGFRLNALSDGGTSNGLFQWHKGRLDNLQKYCGAEYLTSIKCQLDYFMYEITVTPNAQNGIYNYLLGNHSAYDMGYEFCMRFERPAGGASSATVRGNLAQNTYLQYVTNGCQ